jgi:hypothetical protein
MHQLLLSSLLIAKNNYHCSPSTNNLWWLDNEYVHASKLFFHPASRHSLVIVLNPLIWFWNCSIPIMLAVQSINGLIKGETLCNFGLILYSFLSLIYITSLWFWNYRHKVIHGSWMLGNIHSTLMVERPGCGSPLTIPYRYWKWFYVCSWHCLFVGLLLWWSQPGGPAGWIYSCWIDHSTFHSLCKVQQFVIFPA